MAFESSAHLEVVNRCAPYAARHPDLRPPPPTDPRWYNGIRLPQPRGPPAGTTLSQSRLKSRSAVNPSVDVRRKLNPQSDVVRQLFVDDFLIKIVRSRRHLSIAAYYHPASSVAVARDEVGKMRDDVRGAPRRPRSQYLGRDGAFQPTAFSYDPRPVLCSRCCTWRGDSQNTLYAHLPLRFCPGRSLAELVAGNEHPHAHAARF